MAHPLRTALPRSWYALFAHHAAPLPIQAQAIPLLLAGRECLLCAPTAGGKTEALVAAGLEQLKPEPKDRPQILYICPTRALVNDTFRRLSPIAARLGVRIGRHTADHPPDNTRLPALLITTPEALDSRLVRHPATLRSLRWLLLDELHLLAGSLRGDQLAVLVTRTRAIVRVDGGELRVAAASATVDAPEAVAARYLVNPEVVSSTEGGARWEVSRVSIGGLPEAVVALCAQPGKTLVFANARNDVEGLAHALRDQRPFGDSVYAHHGSLVKDERERVERQFLDRKNAICIATNTLELGIDIGDVDRVAMYGPPPDVASFLQRAGRAGRRSRVAELLLLERNQADHLRFEFLERAALEGKLYGALPAYHPASVVQQAASMLMQNRNRLVTAAAVLARLPPWQAGHLTEDRLTDILGARPDYFTRQPGGVFTAGKALEYAFDRGRMHSQIAGESAGVVVRDRLTQRAIGVVQSAGERGSMTIGGRAAVIASRRGDDVFVDRLPGTAALPAKFKPAGRPIWSQADARAYVEHLGLKKGHAGLAPGLWIHGLGDAAGLVFAAALARLGFVVEADGPLVLRTSESLLTLPPTDVPEVLIESALNKHERKLAKLTGQGPDFAHLPVGERERSLILALHPTALRRAWAGLVWTVISEDVVDRINLALGRT